MSDRNHNHPLVKVERTFVRRIAEYQRLIETEHHPMMLKMIARELEDAESDLSQLRIRIKESKRRQRGA